jgi:hypothetical protein
METIYESDFQRYKIDKGSNFLQADWFDRSEEMSDEDFKNEMEKELEYVEKFNIENYLIDTLNFRFIIKPNLQAWADTHINTKLDTLGLKKLAYVVSQDYIAQLSITQRAKALNKTMKRVFLLRLKRQKLGWLSK